MNARYEHVTHRAMAALVGALLLLAALGAAAQEAATVPLGRGEVVDRIRQTNPDVARAASAVARATAERRGALAVLDPVLDARLELSHARTPTEAGLSAGIATNDRYALSAGVARIFSPGTQLSVGLSQAVTRSEFPLRIGFGFDDQRIVSGPDVETQLSVEVRQPLLRGFGRDVVLLADLLAARAIDVRELEALAAAEAATLEAMLAYTELRYADDEVALRQRSLARTEQQLDIALAEIEAGQIAPIEADLVRERIAMRREALIVARVERARRSRQLARVLGDEAGAVEYRATDATRRPPPVEFGRALCDEAAAASPTMAALDAQRRLAEARTVGTSDRVRPSLEASAGVRQSGLDAGWAASVGQALTWDAPTVFGGVVFTTPLRNRAARAEHEVALADVQAAAFELEETRRRLCHDVEDAVATLQLQVEREAIARERVQLATRAVDAERERFASGLSTVQFGLDNLETLETTEIALLRVATDAELAWWQLLFVRGRLLESVGGALVAAPPSADRGGEPP